MVRFPACHRNTKPLHFQAVWAIASGAALRAVLLVFCCAMAAMLVAVPSADAKMRRDTLILATMKGEHVIEVEVARTPEEKSLGLMFRRSVPEGTGMLFPYDAEQEISMWMRNTYVPLDMIFIRADGTVHRIEAHTEPLSERIISSRGNVKAVLELAAGAAERLGLRPGDRVLHAHFGTGKR
jgi:uncharacterized membrane protein (UPF0127 family)